MSVRFVQERQVQNTIEYVFVVNGMQKAVREADLKKHPGCFEALPQRLKDKIGRNREWLSKL